MNRQQLQREREVIRLKSLSHWGGVEQLTRGGLSLTLGSELPRADVEFGQISLPSTPVRYARIAENRGRLSDTDAEGSSLSSAAI